MNIDETYEKYLKECKTEIEALNAKREAQSKYRYVGHVDHMGVKLTRSSNTIGNVVSQLSNSMEMYLVSQNNMLGEGESIDIKITREK